MATISGIWAFTDSHTIDLFKYSPSQAVNFIDDNGVEYEGFDTGSSDEGGISYRNMYYIYKGETEGKSVYVAEFSSSGIFGNWSSNSYRYLQFGELQEVSDDFRQFMEENAISLGEGVIESGDYCFKLNLYNHLRSSVNYMSIPLIFYCYGSKMTSNHLYVYNDNSNEQKRIALYGDALDCFYDSTDSLSAKFDCFNWKDFSYRSIRVDAKQYLPHSAYNFINNVLIPLNPNNYLDMAGAWSFTEDVKKITDLAIQYARYTKYVPVVDVLYSNTSGTTSVTGLDLSKYTYVTLRARATSTFAYPTSTSFAVKNIEDCDGSMVIQICDNKNYTAWTITNSSIIKTTQQSGTSGGLLYEVIGYRWDKQLVVDEEDTPTYSYKYVRGKLACEQGQNFNNYYNADGGTEFRVELNFRISQNTDISDGVELASNTASSNTYWKLYVNSSGQLALNQAYNGNSATATWSGSDIKWAIIPDTWYTLSLYSNNLKSTSDKNTQSIVYASIVPYTANPTHNYVSRSLYRWSQVTTTRDLYIGDTNIELRDKILIKGTKYHDGVTNTQNVLSVNVEDATVGEELVLSSGDFVLKGGEISGVKE